MMWFTTTAWMMWNALGVRAAARHVPGAGRRQSVYPDLRRQWQLVEETGATFFGVSPGYLLACRRAGLRPGREFELQLRQLACADLRFRSMGSYTPARSWVPRAVSTWVAAERTVLGHRPGQPLLPVWAGEMSGRCLGVAAYAYDPAGRPVVDELGELVITRRFRRCRWVFGAMKTEAGTGSVTSGTTRGSGDRETGSASVPAAARR